MNTSTGFFIEPLTSQDWGEFNRIELFSVQEPFVPTPQKIQAQYIFERNNGKPPFEIYLIKLDEKIVGFFTLTMTENNYLWFGGFQVDRLFQQCGAGRAVIKNIFHLIAKCPEYQGLMLNVQCRNKSTVSFYKRMGLEYSGMMKVNDESTWLMKITRKNVIQLNESGE